MKAKSEVVKASVLTTSMICLIFSMPIVFALPPDPNFGSQNQCKIRDGPSGEKDQYINCC